MKLRTRFVIATALISAAICLLFGGFFGYRYAQDLENQFIEGNIIPHTDVLAETVGRHLNLAGLSLNATELSTLITMEGKFYAQVVRDGKAFFVSGDISLIERTPEPAPFSERLWFSKRFLPNGTPFIDVIRVLDLGSPTETNPRENFIRLGYSMAHTSNQINRQFVQIVLSGLILVLVATVGSFLAARRWLRSDLIDAHTISPQVPTAQIDTKTPTEGIFPKLRAIEIDEKSKQVRRAGQVIAISPREFALLRLLASEPGRVFSSEEILKTAWADNATLTPEDVKKYIYQLRQKLEPEPENPRLILTIRGFGYKISND
jgi:hypothetical protein